MSDTNVMASTISEAKRTSEFENEWGTDKKHKID